MFEDKSNAFPAYYHIPLLGIRQNFVMLCNK